MVDLFLKINQDSVFVFDDLERCNIEISNLLGYINNFVEFKNQKVILIANEEKILESKSADKYREIKEKLIGREFYISPSQKEAIDLFVKNLNDEDLVKYSKNIKELLSDIFTKSRYDNLRLVQQSLSCFEYFFKSFFSKAKDDQKFFERMFCEFIIIFIEYKKGKIKSEDFFGEYPHFFKGLHKSEEQEHFLDKYKRGLSNWITCFNVKILGKILQGIELSEEDKKNMIDNLEDVAGVNKESWQQLWHCYDQSDEVFFKNLKDVQDKWESGRYENILVVLHVFGMLIGFSNDRLIKKEKEDIFDEGKEYIERLFEENKIPLNMREENTGFSWRESAYGLGYSGMDNEEWRRFIGLIDKKLDEFKSSYIKQKIANELMPILKSEKKSLGDLKLLMNHNFFHHNGNKEAYFQYFDLNILVDILINADRMLLGALRKTFEERYGVMFGQIKDIELEIPFLKKLERRLRNEIEIIEKKFGQKTPRSHLLSVFVDQAIKPFNNK